MKCKECGKDLQVDKTLCDRCEREITEYRKLLNRFRVRKYRILHGDPEQDGFSVPLMQTQQEAIHQLERERQQELVRLKQRHHKPFDPDPLDKQFQQYEKELASLDGDTDLFYRKHGFDGHPHRKGEFVEFENGRLVKSKTCDKCSCLVCRCPTWSNQPLNFRFGE